MAQDNAGRVSAEEARRLIDGGAPLVCAYDDDAKCDKLALRGAIRLSDLEARLGDMSPGEPILLYCA